MAVELRNPPKDSINSLCFSPSQSKNTLACTSWDGALHVYNCDSNSVEGTQTFQSEPLDCTFLEDHTRVVVCGLTQCLHLCDIRSGTNTVIGKHDGPVRHVRFHEPTGLIYSGSWDGTVRAWDMRASRQVSAGYLHGKTYAMDINKERLVVCDSKKRTYIYDIRDGPHGLGNPGMRDQLLKFQFRAVRCFPNGEGFAASSIEGRVTWEYFDHSPELQEKRYAFKCHRSKAADGTEIAYPVNALAFHPKYGTFATGGSDGGVSIWDGQGKKRLFRVPNLQTGVAGLAFNAAGTMLAVGVSYGYEEGPKEGIPAPQILIRHVREEDVKPKA